MLWLQQSMLPVHALGMSCKMQQIRNANAGTVDEIMVIFKIEMRIKK